MTEVDKSKLAKAMEIIDRAASLIEKKNYENDAEVMRELTILDNRLKELAGNDEVSVYDFEAYWSYQDLEESAVQALMPKPEKKGISDKEIADIVKNINNSPEKTDYWLEILEKETGLENISDYIFWPDEIGLEINASIEEIIHKIFQDRKK